MENKKKNKVLKVLGLVGLFVLVFGLSYALFRITLTGRKKTRIKTANFGLTLTDINGNEETEGIAVDLQNAVPETDEEGLSRDGYKFVVTNTGNIPASYELKLNSTGDLSTEYIKYALIEKDYLKKANGDYYMGGIYNTAYRLGSSSHSLIIADIPTLSTLDQNKLHKTTLLPGEKMEYELKLWIDHDAGIAASNKTYEANVVIEGSQAEEYMTGPTGDNAKYTLYKDGTMAITGSGALKTIAVDDATDNFEIFNNGGASFAIIKDVLERNGYVVDFSSDDESQIFTLMCYALYNGVIDGEILDDYQGLPGDLKEWFNQYFGSDEVAESIWNEIGSVKVTRVVIDEGITSTIDTFGFSDLLGDYMLTAPSTLTDVTYLKNDLYGTSVYGLIIPDNVTTIPGYYKVGRSVRYIDLNNVETIESKGLWFNQLRELYIPNTVSRIDADGIMGNSDITINIDNTREYVESHWSSDWIISYSGNVTINYLR